VNLLDLLTGGKRIVYQNLISLGKEKDWVKLEAYKDTFGFYDYCEYFYHDRFEEKLNQIM